MHKRTGFISAVLAMLMVSALALVALPTRTARADTGGSLFAAAAGTDGVATANVARSSVTAQEGVVHEGTWGECSWSIDEDGLLTIWPTNGVSGKLANSRTGVREDLMYFPWRRHCSLISTVVVRDGVVAPEDARGLFVSCSATSMDVSALDMSQVTNMSGMFAQCSSLTYLDLSAWDTSAVRDMGAVFGDCSSLVSVELADWDTSQVMSMNQMFEGCSSLTHLDLSGWDTSHVRVFQLTFARCSSLATVYVGDGWSIFSARTTHHMFYGCTALVGGAGTVYGEHMLVDSYYAHADSPNDPGYLTYRAYDPSQPSVRILKFKSPVTRYSAVSVVDGILTYKLPVAASDATVTLDLTVSDGATWKLYADAACMQGCPITGIALAEGDNLYYVRVTNGDVLATYGVNLRRAKAPKTCKVRYGGGADDVETFDNTLESYLSYIPSTTYSPRLAHLAAALACSAYNASWVQESYESLGFPMPVQANYPLSSRLSAYSVAVKRDDEYGTVALVTIRGSYGGDDNSLTSPNWLNNLVLGASAFDGGHWHAGFEADANAVLTALKDVLGGSIKTSGVKYFVCGHSQGAAAANIVEAKLIEAGVAQTNVYGYNIACPDTATRSMATWNADTSHDNIFNIGNSHDPVTIVPGVIGDTLFARGTTVWGKYGKSLWFADIPGWDDADSLSLTIAAHGQQRYLYYLRNADEHNWSTSIFKNWWDMRASGLGNAVMRVFAVRCPVDVIVKDAAGTVVASVVGGEVDYHGGEFGQVVIMTAGDEKVVAVPDGQGYQLELTGTGDGTMTLEDAACNLLTGETSSEKSFAGVALCEGRELRALAGAKNAEDTRLFVMDDSAMPVAEVAGDGMEHDVMPTDSITLVPEELSLSGIGATATLVATVAPADATFQDVVWESSDTSVVTVSEDGLVTAVGEGAAAVTARTADGKTASVPVSVGTAEGVHIAMHRLYNPNSGEHFYTGNTSERDHLASLGWAYEGVGWTAPGEGEAVFRLYNPNAGDHHYTVDVLERDFLVSIGWNDEGVGWHSAPSSGMPLHRLYNPNATGAGAHHYTTDASERDSLVSLGWSYEGVGWYGVS